MISLGLFNLAFLSGILLSVEGAYPKFKCDNGEYYSSEVFCDGIMQCSDESDEKEAKKYFSDKNLIGCNNSENIYNKICMIHSEYICSDIVQCTNLSPCDINCTNYYKCQDSGECVDRRTVCDGNSCNGCVEDHGWNNGVGFKCMRNGLECILPQQLLRDSIADCDGGTDLCYKYEKEKENMYIDLVKYGGEINRNNCFECLDGNMIVSKTRLCDGVIDCADFSDECLCEGTDLQVCSHIFNTSVQEQHKVAEVSIEAEYKEVDHFPFFIEIPQPTLRYKLCEFGDFMCDNGSCIEKGRVCDGEVNCIDFSDESFEYCDGTMPCTFAKRNKEKCRCHSNVNNCARHVGRACDGVAECPENHSLDLAQILDSDNDIPEDECSAICQSNYSCKYDVALIGEVHEHVNYVCTSSTKINNSSFLLWSHLIQNDTYETHMITDGYCDGVLLCDVGREDESNCANRFMCEVKRKNFVSIELKRVCDGHIDCDDASDEYGEECQEKRFFCPALGGSMVNIDRNLVCDFISNCDNGEDEMICPGRFFCENREPLFISENKVIDGRADCTDWSDECPSNKTLAKEDIFSSRYELIANPVLRACVWLMGIGSVIGNMAVCYSEVCTLYHFKMPSGSMLANRILILNLAIADCLMGIYLITLGSVAAFFKGRYCANDIGWRTSDMCNVLGVINIISAETSVMLMLCLTAYRLYSVLRPLDASYFPTRIQVISTAIICWSTAIALAFIPLGSAMAHTFTSAVFLGQNPFTRNAIVNITTAKNFLESLIFYDTDNISQIRDIFEEHRKRLCFGKIEKFTTNHYNHPKLMQIDGQFGYYNAHAVCMPNLFVSPNEATWFYTLLITVFNFVSFILVFLGYTIIYKTSKKRSGIRRSVRGKTRNNINSMQRKIFRLIVSDFCCWIPICVMSFLTLAGVKLNNNVYAFAAIILLPINSALNPLLYSNIPDKVIQFIRKCWQKKKDHRDGFTRSIELSTVTQNISSKM